MAKHLVKVSKVRGQFRVTLPILLIERLRWDDVEFVLLDDSKEGTVCMRRFIDGESLKGADEADRNGGD
jgi:bifunctional DNA-binding transcriptional regulator/antitoxin component of YhaV-PrlF toxin-antitoxin module